MRLLPNRAIEAAQTVHFQAVGYPTRVADVAELWRFADVMQEFRLKPTFDVLGGLTEREYELVASVTETVAALTTSLGRKVVPGAALIRAVLVYRAIKVWLPGGGAVFELGAGSGYVGALLLADGFDYRASDVAQAFALWQANLFNAIRPGVEATLPWWEWMAGPDKLPPLDVFTANHMLNEMHSRALMHALKRAKQQLKPGGVLMVEDFGSPMLRKNADTLAVIRQLAVPVVMVGPGLDLAKPTRNWADMEALWSRYGGVPQSADEQFLEAFGF